MRSRFLKTWVLLALATQGAIYAQEPKINIVRGDQALARYADAASGADEQRRAELFSALVSEPYRKTCSPEGDGSDMSDQYFDSPISNLAAIRQAVAEIGASNIEDFILAGLRPAMEALPSNEVTVCVFPLSPESPMADWVKNQIFGLLGFSDTRGVIWVQPLQLASGWRDRLPAMIAHEYEHAVSSGSAIEKKTVLDHMVEEGRGDSFALQLFPEFVGPWTHALTPEEERADWKIRLPYLDVPIDSLTSELQGANPWGAYTIGFHIVQSYLARHPEESPRRWTQLTPKELFQQSGYAPP
jgi:uncharacterized protein YjaZ